MLASIAQRCCAAASRAATATTRVTSRPPVWSLYHHAARCPPNLRKEPRTGNRMSTKAAATGPEALGMSHVLFVEVGMGADQHGWALCVYSRLPYS